MAPSMQEVEEILVKSYKKCMTEVMANSFLTFLEICDCHRALCDNILEALEESLTPKASGPYKKHMTKAFETQLHVCLLKRQQKVQTIAGLVAEVTQKAVEVYENYLEMNQSRYTDSTEKKEFARVFREMTTDARTTSIKYFLDNCHFSSEKALLVALKDKEEDFLEEFIAKHGEFKILEDSELIQVQDTILVDPVEEKIEARLLKNSQEISPQSDDVIDAGQENVPKIQVTTQDTLDVISDDASSEIGLSDVETDVNHNDGGFKTPGTEFSSAEVFTEEDLKDLIASQFQKNDVQHNHESYKELDENPKHELNHANSDATSGYFSRESSFAHDSIANEPSAIKPDSHWWTVIGNVSRRGSDGSTANTAFKQQAFQTIASTIKLPTKSISRLVIFFGSTNIYARYFDDANGKTGKSAQTIEPYILLGHQKLIGELAMQFSSEDTQNILNLLYENPTATLDHQKLSAEEILAEFLKQIHLTLAAGSTSIQEYIIIYPANLTPFQKRRLTIAADLAEFNPTIFISLHTFLAALQMTCDGIKDSNTMMIHFSPKAFDVVIGHLDSHRPAIASYTGAEDLRKPMRFQSAHSYLIHYAATHGEDVPLTTQKAAGRFYKEIISKGLEFSKLEWSDIENILIIYDPPNLEVKLDSVFDSADISEDVNANEMDETEVLNAAISEVTFEQAAEIQDIHSRNFGIIINKEIVHFYTEKNIPIEEDEEIEVVLPNVHLGWNNIIVGCEAENETYRFLVDNKDVSEVAVCVKFDPVFLYNVSVKTTEGIELDVENVTFPYLCEL